MKKDKQKTKSAKFSARAHWKGMPKFNQPDKGPVKTLQVNFENMDDVLKFSKVIGQEITAKTKSVWYPRVYAETNLDIRYSDKKK
jgi:hypothetical protein